MDWIVHGLTVVFCMMGLSVAAYEVHKHGLILHPDGSRKSSSETYVTLFFLMVFFSSGLYGLIEKFHGLSCFK